MTDKDDKKAILVVSFGTSHNDTRKITLEAIEERIKKEFYDYEIRSAYTSKVIINKLKKRDGIEIDDVKKALERLFVEGFNTVLVQPTHIMKGFEFEKIQEEVESFSEKFNLIKLGKPLLSSDCDYDELVSILTRETKDYNDRDTAIVFMGHGTEHTANIVYGNLQKRFISKGYNNYFVGTVEAKPTLEDITLSIDRIEVDKIVILPFMIVAGDHATNDMAGDKNSWKTHFESKDYIVKCILKGLGEYESIQDIIVEHIHNL